MKILFISNVPSPYNVSYLNELGKQAEVTAVFEMGSSSERDKSWKKLDVQNFECVLLKGLRLDVDKALSCKVRRYVKAFRNDTIIIGNPTTPTGIVAILYCQRHKIPYVLQSEGGFQGSGKGLKEKLKTHLMKDAALYLSGMSIENEYFLKYGASADKIVQYPFTSFYAADVRQDTVSDAEKEALRQELGVTEKTVFISVGQFIPRKGFDILLKAYKGMPEGVGLYIVGGEPTKEYVRLVEENGLRGVHFLGFKDKQTLKKYYAAADVFVLATREDTWGLVINEAMSLGLPVITTDRCIAGLTLIENGINGYIVPTEDVQRLREKMEQLVLDQALREKMAAANLKKIKGYTFETMAKTIFEAVSKLQS